LITALLENTHGRNVTRYFVRVANQPRMIFGKEALKSNAVIDDDFATDSEESQIIADPNGGQRQLDARRKRFALAQPPQTTFGPSPDVNVLVAGILPQLLTGGRIFKGQIHFVIAKL